VHYRLEEDQVAARVGDQPCRLDLGEARGLGGHADRLEVERDADLGTRGQGGAQRLRRQAVAEQQVVGGRGGGGRVSQAGGMDAEAVPEMGDHVRFVEGDPARHPVAECLGDGPGVVGEPLRGVP
jgi:hypothetical protein